MELLKGAPAAKRITEDLQARVNALPRKPKMAFVRLGEEPGDLSYERAAIKRIEKIGAEWVLKAYPRDMEEEAFLREFKAVNEDPSIDGILLFRPLPKQIDERKAAALVRPEKDLDCMSDLSFAAVMKGTEGFAPCTAEAVTAILHAYGIETEGKRVVVVGRSLVIGRPAAMLLLQENATVTICHSKTSDLQKVCREADILVAALGRAEKIDASYVKEGAIVVDVGIHVKEDGSLCGDCHAESVSERASMMTPVPGGVGTVTTAVLASHLVRACEMRTGEKE